MGRPGRRGTTRTYVALLAALFIGAGEGAWGKAQQPGRSMAARTSGTAAIVRVPEDRPTIQAGIDAARDGDVVLVSPGVYEENLVLSGKTITLASRFHTTRSRAFIGRTVIDGGRRTVIEVKSSVGSETEITGFTIRNGNDGISASAKLRITDNIFFGNGDGIDYEGGGGLCRGNVFENNRDDGIDLDRSTAAVIENNVIRNNRDDGIEIRLHRNSGPRLDIVIRDNVITGNREDGIQIIDHPGVSRRLIVVARNLIAGNAMAGIGLMDNGDTKEDYRAASISDPIHVFNNSIVDNDHGLAGGDNLVVINNIIAGSRALGVKSVDGRSIVAHNLFWNNGVDARASNLDSGSTLYANPLLGEDFRPSPQSPAIDAGVARFAWRGKSVLRLPHSEFSGKAPDLGAFETGLPAE